MIEKLIITSPYEEPRQHYSLRPGDPHLCTQGGPPIRRLHRGLRSLPSFDDPVVFIELPQINQIRSRVKTKRRFLG